MFTRERSVGRHRYTEALINYRDPDTGKSRHRYIARWPAGRPLGTEIGQTQFEAETAASNVAVFQQRYEAWGRPVSERWPGYEEWRRKHRKRTLDKLTFWRRRLAYATARLDGLNAARLAIPVDDGEIEQARQAAADRIAALVASFHRPDVHGTLAALAARACGLAVENDPDAVRAGLVAIADALAGLAAGA
jgi:hypothetical protein